MEEYKGIDYLKKKLAQKYVRANQRYNFYEMKYFVKDLGISTPPDLRRWFNVLGWCGTAVDNIADRISFRTFEHDIFGMNEIYAVNNADILFDSGILGALITACDFIYITRDNDGYPQMRIIDKMNEYMGRRDYEGAERHLKYWLTEAVLGKDLAQLVDFRTIAAVQRGHRAQHVYRRHS